MAKVACLCGHYIDLSPLPAPEGHYHISEVDADALELSLEDLVARYHALGPDALYDRIFHRIRNSFRRFLQCAACGRLVVYWTDGPEGTFYAQEKGEDGDGPPSADE